MKQSIFVTFSIWAMCTFGLAIASLVPIESQAQSASEHHLASRARKELLGRNFKLVDSNIRARRVTIHSQKKLATAHAQSSGETQALISSALGEIVAMPRLAAVCNPEQMKNNIAHLGISMMYDSFSFFFKPSRDVPCDQLTMREIEMKPLELTSNTLKLQLTMDRHTLRNATCTIASTNGFLRLWKNVTATCMLEDLEGAFTLDID